MIDDFPMVNPRSKVVVRSRGVGLSGDACAQDGDISIVV